MKLERRLRRLGHLVVEHIGAHSWDSRAAWPSRRAAGRAARSCRACRWRRPSRRASSCVEQRLARRAVGQRWQQRLLGRVLQRRAPTCPSARAPWRHRRRRRSRRRVSPASFALSSTTSAPALAAASSFCWKAVSSAGDLAVDGLQPRLVGRRRELAPAWTNCLIGQRQHLQLLGVSFSAVRRSYSAFTRANSLGSRKIAS